VAPLQFAREEELAPTALPSVEDCWPHVGWSLLIAVLILLWTPTATLSQTAPETPFSQGARATLERNFPSQRISYLLMDTTGSVVAERWPDQTPISPGSLVKPFLAVAYGEQHAGNFPTVRCLGTRDRCWLPSGHGPLGLEEALAQSCNAYFLELAGNLDRNRASESFSRYGLTGPAQDAAGESLAGLGSAWKEQPLVLARAFLKIEKEQQFATQARIAKGMLVSASRGTARGVDAALGDNSALAKTGTAVCSHTPQGAADGFTVVLYPAAQPRLLLLVRVHGITGAETAKIAGAMLKSFGEGVGER